MSLFGEKEITGLMAYDPISGYTILQNKIEFLINKLNTDIDRNILIEETKKELAIMNEIISNIKIYKLGEIKPKPKTLSLIHPNLKEDEFLTDIKHPSNNIPYNNGDVFCEKVFK